ncbi:MAG: DbpA RNA binding domain-containing protein, partial [archaeon]|nr:DbpA RNA binding domain-containing protein [archaeon]
KKKERAEDIPEPDQPVRKERTLHGKLDRKTRRESQSEKTEAKERNQKRSRRESQSEKAETAEGRTPRKSRAEAQDKAQKKIERQPKERKPAAEKKAEASRPDSARPENNNGQKMQYVPQGVPKNPRPLHSYVGIVRAARPKKDMSFDRLELNVGSEDGLDVESLKKFVIRTAGIEPKDVGNLHISENKSRVQVVRYRSQEVVDELFGQVVNGKRVMVFNLSDKQ